jgi:hypothetical protein
MWKQRRLLSTRTRRRLAATARRAATYRGGPSRYSLLLQDRAAAASEELLDVALILERAGELDASWMREAHKLLTDGCGSPLYNPDIHVSELWATLYYLRISREPAGKLPVRAPG